MHDVIKYLNTVRDDEERSTSSFRMGFGAFH